MQIDDFDEIVIENEYEHIYGFKDGEAIEIISPHNCKFAEECKKLLCSNYVVSNNTEFEMRLLKRAYQ